MKLRKFVVSEIKRFPTGILIECRSQWLRGLRRGPATAHLLGLRVRIPLEAWMSVSCECCVLSGRGFCVGLTTRPEESYSLWCVWVWSWSVDDVKALPWPTGGLSNHGLKKIISQIRPRHVVALIVPKAGPEWRPIYRASFTIACSYRGGGTSLARPTSRCILFDGENITFDASLVVYINSTNIPPIMIINRIYENQNLPPL
jgi:hypothetical protein